MKPTESTCQLDIQVVGESSVRTIPEVGTRVIHTFHVVNEGPWPAHSAQVNIDWPFQVAALLYRLVVGIYIGFIG